jgi:hypothetical protein
MSSGLYFVIGKRLCLIHLLLIQTLGHLLGNQQGAAFLRARAPQKSSVQNRLSMAASSVRKWSIKTIDA